ncbi:CopD family protein [Bosea sp. 2YAB26]|uniref:CopD family protein n=1 Tax=Bosea sp. 2YAB26 TaxID=3237478 RepID=UPI003F92A44E
MTAFIEAALPAIRWLHLAALLSSLGTEAFRLLAWGRLGAAPEATSLLRRLARFSRAGVVLSLVSGGAWLWFQGSAMLGNAVASREAALAILQTLFGGTLLLRLALLVVSLWMLHSEGRGRWLALPLLAAAAFLQGGLGHGAATEGWVTIALGLHVVAAGLWLGALLPLLATCFLLPSQAAAIARRFTPLGLACVLTLALTSLMQVQALLGTLAATLGTNYGRLALLKLVLFAVLLGIASANRFRFVPQAEAGGSIRGLRRSLALEAGVGLAMVAAAAALASQPPGIHEQPDWPLPLRPIPGLWDDAYLRDGLLRLLGPIAITAALFILAVVLRKLRWPALAAGAAALVYIQVPPWRPYVVAAVPTSFQLSPTGYSARSIAAGRALFQRDCTSCHGLDARGRGPVAVAQAVWPPDLSAPLIAGRPGGELFWSIRHGAGPMPAATGLGDAEIWALIDFIRLRAGARIYDRSEMRFAGAARMPGFVAGCQEGVILAPGDGRVLRLWIEGTTAQVQADGAAARCPVEDPEPLATALAELTGGGEPPAQVLIDANGWLRRAFGTDANASPDILATELKLIREQPYDGSSHH